MRCELGRAVQGSKGPQNPQDLQTTRALAEQPRSHSTYRLGNGRLRRLGGHRSGAFGKRGRNLVPGPLVVWLVVPARAMEQPLYNSGRGSIHHTVVLQMPMPVRVVAVSMLRITPSKLGW